VRVVIAEDQVLLREGLGRLFEDGGHQVVASFGDAEGLLPAIAEHDLDLVVLDIRMPPSFTDEGLRAAHEIRVRHPDMGIVILSQDVEAGTAARLLAESPAGLGYLLKDRVGDAEEFAGTLRRVAAGGSALDPQVVARWLASTRGDGPLATLSPREREVLGLLAEGRSNRAIGERLQLSQRAVQKHVTAVFAKLGLESDEDDNRRVLAVLAYLRGAA
jgi:DNA-binding NarL/FixJ family response regulator